MSFTISVIIICLLLAAITVWFEYRRDDKSRLGWRVTAVLIAVIALACIALPISYNSTITTGKNEVTLLTDGFNKDSVKVDGKLFTLDKSIKKAYPKVVLLTGVLDIANLKPAVKQLHVSGYGLDESDLKQLAGIKIIYNTSVAPSGITTINWPQQLKTGEQLQVQGSYINGGAKAVKLLFKGLNTSLDSVIIPAGKSTEFELTATPKITGRAAYTLLALSGKDTLEKENIPVSIEVAKPVRVLMLSASPDFETKFLKNWLGQNGYVVASRTIITKNKTGQDFLNMPQQSLDVLTPAVLGKFDVVIGDLSTLKTLTPPEASALKQQVQAGLGVIVRADSSGNEASWLQNNFRVSTIAAKAVSTPLLIQGLKEKTTPLSVDPSYISNAGNIQTLVVDPQAHILAGSTIAGEGKLIFSTLRTTYSWSLSGSSKDYTALWSLLINKATRKIPPASQWSSTQIPFENEPSKLQIQTGMAPGNPVIDNAVVGTVQDAFIPYQWSADYWPAKPGWQQIRTDLQASSWVYVYPKNSWETIKNLKKTSDTKKYADNFNNLQSVTKLIQTAEPIEVPKMYFYLLLLAACTFLWVERKLST